MTEEVSVESQKGRDAGRMGLVIKLLVWVPLAVLGAVIVAALFTKQESTGDRRPRPKIGEAARDFTYPDLSGSPVTLSSFYGDKVVLVNVWATWCTSCRKELPTLQKMYEQLKGDDLEVLAVSIDALGARAVGPYMKDFGYTFPALQNINGDIQQLYGTTGVPESFVVDKGGTIAMVEVGPGDWSTDERITFVRSLMNEPDGGVAVPGPGEPPGQQPAEPDGGEPR